MNPKLSNYNCDHCGKKFGKEKNLQKHALIHTRSADLPCVCVDKTNGIYFTAFTKSGVSAPIHVKSHKGKQIQLCEIEDCNITMQSGLSGNPGIDCVHLKAVFNAKLAIIVHLDPTYLKELKDLNVIGQDKKYLDMQAASLENKCPLVSYADFTQFGRKSKLMYFSVFTNVQEYWCRFGRVRVTFDSEDGEWSCKCPQSGETTTCPHENAVKWYLCQVDKDLLLKHTR